MPTLIRSKPDRTKTHPAIEVRALRKVYDAGGVVAFDRAARRILIAVAALVVHVEGRDRLSAIIDTIEATSAVRR